MMNGMPAMGFMMWLFMLIFWGLFILGLVVAVRWFVDRGKTKPGDLEPQTPLEILKMRYARGEITKDEFERMKQELE